MEREGDKQVHLDEGESGQDPVVPLQSVVDGTALLEGKAEELLTALGKLLQYGRQGNSWNATSADSASTLLQHLMVLFRGAHATDLAWTVFQAGCETFGEIIFCCRGSFTEFYEQIIEQMLKTFRSNHAGHVCRTSILKLMKIMTLTCPLGSQCTITRNKAAFFEALSDHVGEDFVVTEAALKLLEVLAFMPMQSSKAITVKDDTFMDALANWCVAFFNTCDDKVNSELFATKMANIVCVIKGGPTTVGQTLTLYQFMDRVAISKNMDGHLAMVAQFCILVTRLVFVWNSIDFAPRENIVGYCRIIIDQYSKENAPDHAAGVVSDLQTLLRILV